MNEGFDFSNIVRNIGRRWKEIIMIALIAAFAAGTVSCFMYRPEYRTKATIVVLEKEMYKWSGVSNAENTAGIFREIVSSKVLKDKVADSLGLDSLPGTVSCSNIRNTNMMILTVTASSPRDAMLTINGILEHYNEFSETILSDQVLQVLETPKVPESVANPFSGWSIIIKVLLAAAVLEILILFLYFYLHDDIKNPGQIEKKLDTKLIASVYHEKKKRVRKGGGEILVSAPTTSFGYIETFRKIAMKVSYRKSHLEIFQRAVAVDRPYAPTSFQTCVAWKKTPRRFSMTDIHMHILPGFDDGARDIYESLEMADEAARDGVTDIVATPHCNVPGMSGNYRGSGYEERFSALKNAITQERIPVKLHRGMEVFATEGLTKLIRDEKVLTLAGSRYLLVEFDFGGDPEFADRILDGILSCGLVPVVAHAERYEFVRYDIETVERWRKKGCLIQLNKGSFTGNCGGEVLEAAFFIASQRLADAVASDAHGTDRRTVYMSRAREIVSREISPRYAKYLFDTSPHGIVCDPGAREP